MCDYSLHAVPNRLAKEGEQLVVHRFPTGSIGMASPADLKRRSEAVRAKKGIWAAVREFFDPPGTPQVCAICIPPGAKLLLRDIPESIQQVLCVRAEEEVIFTELTATAFTYRDAVRFWNGRELRLQALLEGQRVEVLALETDENERAVETEMVRRRIRMQSLA